MRYVLDASVAVASLRPNERSHRAAVERVTPLLRGLDEAIVPAIFRVEVASALARAGFEPSDVERFIGEFVDRARVVALGPRRTLKIQRFAVATKLRAADAIYAWTASSHGVPLLTCDREIRTRAGGFCEVWAI